MSGNSSGDPMAAINNNVPAQTPPWMKNVSPQTMPQAMPGQIEALARQLQAGYGGRTQDFMRAAGPDLRSGAEHEVQRHAEEADDDTKDSRPETDGPVDADDDA